MNDEIRKFDFKGAALRTLTDGTGEPWFVAKDVCDILELSNVGQALARLDEDEKNSIILNDGTPGSPNKAIVSEPGIYSLVLASRKPEAREFKRWVTHEVLPRIRRTGGYIPADESDSPEDIMARAVLVAQKTIERKNQQLQAKDARIKVLEPKARFADAVAHGKHDILVTKLAMIMQENGSDIKPLRLFEMLRRDGYLVRRKGREWNAPTQKSMDLGVIRRKESTITHADGHTSVNFTPLITGKGQVYFVRKYCFQPTLEAGA